MNIFPSPKNVFARGRAFLLLFKRTFGLIFKQHRKLVTIILISHFLIAVVPFLQNGAQGLLINNLVAVAQGASKLFSTSFIVGIFIIASLIPNVLYNYLYFLSTKFWIYVEETLEIMIIRKKASLDIAMLESPEGQDLFQKIHDDGTWRLRNFSDYTLYFFQDLVSVMIASSIILHTSVPMFFIIVICTIPELIVEIRHGQRVWGIADSTGATRRKYWELSGLFRSVNALAEVKLFQNMHYFLDQIRGLFKSFHEKELENEQKKYAYQLFGLVLSQCGIGIALLLLVSRVSQGTLEIGTFTFLISSLGNLRSSFSGLFRNLARQYEHSLFVEDFFKFIDLKPVLTYQGDIKLPADRTPEIVFDDVSFTYPSGKTAVLSHISFSIKPGEKIALIGINGAGKSTLIKLLCRFYDPTQGAIYIDGQNLKDIDLDTWYGMMGSLFQNYQNYRLTVKEAISVGDTSRSYSEKRMKEAARDSESSTFIEKWTDKYEQILGVEFEHGIDPSVGQWQKLAIARVLYRDPNIFIFDEPTASIDAEAEAKIFEKLEKLPADRTVILISHRFSTVRKAHKILVLENGKIEEMGTHEELMKKRKTYARLFELQAKGYK